MLPAATPESAANMLPISTPESTANVLPAAKPDSAGNIPPIATPDSATTMVQTTQPAIMPGLPATVVQTILLAATSDSTTTRNNKLETTPKIEPNSTATAVQTTQLTATPESATNMLPIATPESAETKNSKLETEPTILDSPRIKLSGKPIFPITKNLVTPFPGKLAKARKEESKHDIL